MTLPSGAERRRDGDPTPLELALARGHRWLAMLESGEAKSLRDITRKQGVDSSYVSRIVNLTTLAPDIVAAILDETLSSDLTLFDLAVDPPALWEEQPRVGRKSEAPSAEWSAAAQCADARLPSYPSSRWLVLFHS